MSEINIVEKALELIINLSDCVEDRKYLFQIEYGNGEKPVKGYVQVVIEED